jgi:hypothetical protein
MILRRNTRNPRLVPAAWHCLEVLESSRELNTREWSYSKLRLSLPGLKSKVIHEGVWARRSGRIFRVKKRPNAETALQNAFKDHLLDFGPLNLNTDCFRKRT